MWQAVRATIWLIGAGVLAAAAGPACAEPPWIAADGGTPAVVAPPDAAGLTALVGQLNPATAPDVSDHGDALSGAATVRTAMRTDSVARAAPATHALGPGDARRPQAERAGDAALPLPPIPPFPRAAPDAIVLPYTGQTIKPLPVLPPLRAQGSLAALGADRPHAGFSAQTDCILDHQRFDSRGTRQRYPHVCGPTRDLDFDLPAFTTR